MNHPHESQFQSGVIWIIVDMATENKTVQRSNIPVLRGEDIHVQLSGCKYFTKWNALDFKLAFLQIEKGESSQYITIFNVVNQLTC